MSGASPQTAESAERRVRDLYGGETGDALPRDAGVVHVAAVWVAPDGSFCNMRIVPETPTSPTDAFALALARARADAIVTTGRILREEPDLHYPDGREDPHGLVAWRRVRMGRGESARVAVLTRGAGLDLGHPALAPGRALVLTTRAKAAELAEEGAARGVELVGRDAPGLLDALDHLRGARGCGTVVVEAGPSTTGVLYEAPGRVDELMLSLCHAATLPEVVRGAPFPDREALSRAGLVEVSQCARDEPSGRWTFARYARP